MRTKSIISAIFFTLILSIITSKKAAADISSAWPKLNSFKESECLVFEENKLLMEASAYTKQFSVHAKFLLGNVKGEIYTNAKVNKGMGTLTFSIEKTTPTTYRSGAKFDDCYKRIDIELGADPEFYSKLYVVVDDVVMYEFEL